MGDCNSFILSGLWGIDGRVLIVPSGIETFLKPKKRSTHIAVLIVPSGIETCEKSNRAMEARVLIVPSGIETRNTSKSLPTHQCINCT